jgi:hypothetical protein
MYYYQLLQILRELPQLILLFVLNLRMENHPHLLQVNHLLK